MILVRTRPWSDSTGISSSPLCDVAAEYDVVQLPGMYDMPHMAIRNCVLANKAVEPVAGTQFLLLFPVTGLSFGLSMLLSDKTLTRALGGQRCSAVVGIFSSSRHDCHSVVVDGLSSGQYEYGRSVNDLGFRS